eukprot:10003708-Alexandrium_andersonii.AAC.1
MATRSRVETSKGARTRRWGASSKVSSGYCEQRQSGASRSSRRRRRSTRLTSTSRRRTRASP